MKRWFKVFLLSLSVVAVAVIASASWLYVKAISQPLQFGDEIYLVERGDSISSIAKKLIDKKVITNPYPLKLYVRLKKVGRYIKSGEYKFPDGITISEFVDRLVSGKGQIGIKITIIEGWTFRQMRNAINEAPKLEKLTKSWTDKQIMEELGHPYLHPEGQFYPDTYQYRKGDTDLSIYRKAFLLMKDKLDYAWENRKEDIQIKDPYEALIMASIIEKESQVWDEQPLISGVFENRLKVGMRLQTDPTVIYGLGDEYQGNLRHKHLKQDTPYNTYTRHGLTPTPISLPGFPALLAAVQPEETEHFYFVARGEGRHKFSRTLKEHNAAVRKYILNK